MEELINVLLQNPFFVLLIIGGLYSLFKGKSEKEENRQKRDKEIKRPDMRAEKFPARTFDKQVEEKVPTMSIEEQRQEQMERLTKGLASSRFSENVSMRSQNKVVTPAIERTHKQSEFNKKFKNNLTKEGLAHSIIMAEILGKPRAKKPHFRKY